MKPINKKILYLFTIILIAIPIFEDLNVQAIRVWDESRNAVNAVEMYESGNLLVTTYGKSPDMWNTKPPLLIWLQVFFMKLIGIGELAIRLPSAIAAFLTCIALLILGVKYLKNDVVGIVTVIVLVTTDRYINVHGTRTGDFDALLTLFTTVSAISFFLFIEKQQVRFLYFFFIALSLGVLTKSTAALMILPAIVIYTIWQKQVMSILKSKHFYMGICLFLIPVISFYLLREHNNPGYIKAVQENEFGGRYLSVIENHKADFWFYYTNLLDFDMKTWYLFIPCGLLIGIYSKDEKIRKITFFSIVFIVTYFLVISIAATKITWYAIPMFPFLSIVVAIFIDFIYKTLKNVAYLNQTLKYNIAPILFLFLITITPYQNMVTKTYYSHEELHDIEYYEPSYFLKDAIKKKKDLNNYSLLYDDADSRHFSLHFYVKILENQKMKISYANYKTLVPGNKVITNQQSIKDYLAVNYSYTVIDKYNSVQVLEIMEKRPSTQIEQELAFSKTPIKSQPDRPN